jgi:hypothetical protein
LEVPHIIYGTYKEVNSHLRKRVPRLKREEDWNGLMEAEGHIDTANVPGLLMLSRPNPLLGGDPHFHCYLPHFILLEMIDGGRSPPDSEQEIFEASLRTSWGTLGVLSPANRIWVYPKHRHDPLLRATFRFWETLDAEGERYTVGSATGQRLWSIGSNLKYVMANLGVPTSVLNTPLPEGGPASLVSVDRSS